MGTRRDWTDAHTLLCETCGYLVETLPPEGACPECGRAIRDSAPGARPGSAWQRRPGVRSWAATGWGVLIRPSRVFETISIGVSTDRWLLVTNLAVAGVVVAALPTARLVAGRDPVVAWVTKGGVFAGESRHWMMALAALATFLVVFALLLLLTWIEAVGVRFFGGRRGWRVTRGVAWSVCSHASYGWVVAAALLVLGWGLIDLDFMFAQAMRRVSVRSGVGDWMVLPALLGFFAGMLLFECRVYQGMRVCRYANTRRARTAA